MNCTARIDDTLNSSYLIDELFFCSLGNIFYFKGQWEKSALDLPHTVRHGVYINGDSSLGFQ